jgi:hypothetical protein
MPQHTWRTQNSTKQRDKPTQEATEGEDNIGLSGTAVQSKGKARPRLWKTVTINPTTEDQVMNNPVAGVAAISFTGRYKLAKQKMQENKTLLLKHRTTESTPKEPGKHRVQGRCREGAGKVQGRSSAGVTGISHFLVGQNQFPF